MKSVMSPSFNFAKAPTVESPRSVFNRSHGLKSTFDASSLIPIYVDEALPGDTHKLSLSVYARLSTPLYAPMDNIYMDFFFFACPLRLLQDNFKKMMGEQTDPGDSIAYLCPTVDINGEGVGTLSDYLGLPIDRTSACSVVSYWHRMYNKTFNEWFRCQDLTDSLTVDVDDGPDTIANYQLVKRAKRHDYFTSCLPYPQKANSAVSIPLGTEAAIFGDNMDFDAGNDSANYAQVLDSAGGSLKQLQSNYTYLVGGATTSGTGQLKADLTNATAATINELRTAYQTQRFLERDARSGTRYPEVLRSHFGVINPDARMQRVEYLGGGTIPLHVNPVANTAFTSGTSGSTVSSYAVAQGQVPGFNASFTEHCALLGLVNVRTDITYQQGINKRYLRSTRYDFYWPVFAHLGEQAVQNQEIFHTDGGGSTNTNTFGYNERYAEYRYAPSVITGNFRSDAGTNYNEWHFSEDLASVPSLNNAFIEDKSVTMIDRAIATPAEPQIIYDSYINLTSIRPLPVHGVPGYIDHF